MSNNLKAWVLYTIPIIIIWIIIYLPIKIFTKKSNCFYYALEQRILYGGKIKMVKSKRHAGHHFYYENKNKETFEYTVPNLSKSVSPFKLIIYSGTIRKFRKRN